MAVAIEFGLSLPSSGGCCSRLGDDVASPNFEPELPSSGINGEVQGVEELIDRVSPAVEDEG
ncbi:hypothetical protein ACJ73_08026, partial [Blastomyces percursus]